MVAVGADEVFRIGGFIFDRTSVAVTIDGVPYTGVVEVNGEEAREGELQHGQRTDGTPLGITSGLYMPGPLTFKAYVDTGSMIEQQLAALGFGSFGNALFPLILQVFANPLLPTLTLQWSKVKIEKRKFALPTDAGGLMYEYECKHQGMQTVGEGIGLVGLPSILANYTATL